MRFLARSLGLLLVAAGFVGLVIDGTRSIVNNGISFASISSVANTLFPGSAPGLEQRAYPWLWDSLLTTFFQMPASLTAFLVGALLLRLGQKSLEPIGYLTDR